MKPLWSKLQFKRKTNWDDLFTFHQLGKSLQITKLLQKNMVQDFYPLYLDEELTFGLNGEIISPITEVRYTGFPSRELTVDFFFSHLICAAFFCFGCDPGWLHKGSVN